MGIPLRGRDFRDDENKKESRFAIVNETFVEKALEWAGPDRPALQLAWAHRSILRDSWSCAGRKIQFVRRRSQACRLHSPVSRLQRQVTLVARTHSDPRQVLSALRGEVQKLDPSVSVYAAKTLKEHLGTSLFPARMAAIALGSFGVLALILAAVGIYGVMSHVVAGRTREIGLRMALGAQLSDVQKLILKQGMFLAAIGSAFGLVIALGGARMMKSLLYGVSTSDPITFTGVALLLVGIAFLACWIPARRASRVEPMIVLRAE